MTPRETSQRGFASARFLGLGLVAQALLVTILLHPLLALVLADFRLPTLFERSHTVISCGFEW
jgi:hypothetical protein